MFRTAFEKANAAPEWQAGSLRGRSKEVVAACPLEGLVRRCRISTGNPSGPSPGQELLSHQLELNQTPGSIRYCCWCQSSGCAPYAMPCTGTSESLIQELDSATSVATSKCITYAQRLGERCHLFVLPLKQRYGSNRKEPRPKDYEADLQDATLRETHKSIESSMYSIQLMIPVRPWQPRQFSVV